MPPTSAAAVRSHCLAAGRVVCHYWPDLYFCGWITRRSIPTTIGSLAAQDGIDDLLELLKRRGALLALPVVE
jgi:hypothetical protein